METLPTRYFEEVENVTTEHIKWFVVFLNVKKWRGCVPDERQQPPSLPNQPEHRALQEKAPPSLGPTDTPVRLLQDQLGFHCQATTDRCGFPFATKGYGRHLWDNRSVLQVSARIDNWIALAVGRQIVNLLEDSKDQEAKRISFETAHRRTPSRLSGLESQANQAVENESQANTDDDRSSTRSDSILTFHKKLELRRLRFQLANPNPQHSHLEVGLTFMGCVTESVRSGIAETLSRTEDNSAWSPVIPEEAVSFAISEQLMRSLGRAFFGQITTPFDSTLRERLLWECQNGVQWSWQNKQLNDRFRGPAKAQAEVIETMMLCILGFPSIHLLNHNSIRAIDKSRTANLVFEIWPTAAPQHLRIRLVVDCANSLMIAKIRECETGAAMATLSPTTGFLWQDWRDAFAGRLLGKRSWQKAHSMKELQVRRTTESISRGIQKIITAEDDGDRPVPVFRRQLVWGGWMPFRAGLTLFELKHSSLIILGDSMPTDTYSPTDGFSESTTAESEVQPQDKGTPQEISDTYQRASMSALTDASIHLDALLTLDTNLLDDGPGKPQDEDDDVAESQLVDLVPSASSSSDGQSFRMEFNFDPPLPASILAKASLQDPHAMHILAKWVLTGTKGFQKNYTKALLLMERALILGRNIMTARLLVKTLTDKTFMPDIPVDIDRALAAVELLWRDIAGRHEVVSIENKKVRRWKGDSEAELTRLSKLVCMHQKLVQARPTAEMMRNLADHLSTWGESKPDEHAATVLYETAILASCDSKSILELGRRFHNRDPPFAAAMYQRALVAGQGVAAKLLADLLLSEKNNLRISPAQIADVYERAVRLGHVGAMRELGLLLLHGDDGVLANIVRGRHLAERAVYGDSIARALDSGAASLEIDSRLADQLRASARQAFGSPGGSASGHDTGPRGRS
ncbi:unnamed protein product [Chondrus crispus]|uniref:Sel1-repeat containing protein n=1 Tax=Chondrus crispus TaxID=2769 RepID=R7QJT5_CHOCR|nr:unnamed protein product [Chondrus crispus]CDF37675.1 unnamed protein product [Chondrus crispus]|eukprot:XP_005717546.1 unnamed protein product [Chondrus crispus]